MSRDERSELEQLDALGAELAAAGRVARGVAARGARPDPVWATDLRARLLRELPMQTASIAEPVHGSRDEVREPARGETDAPIPSRPFEGLAERRDLATRPFGGPRMDGRGGREAGAASFAPPISLSRQAPDATGPGASIEADEVGRIVPLRPSMRWRIPTRIAPRPWLATGVAAAAVIAVLAFSFGYFAPDRVPATVNDAVAASIVRDGSTTALLAGTSLREGDEVDVATGGTATIGLGQSVERLSGGARVRIERLERGLVVVNQVAGRVYHRVVLPGGGEYRVLTAAVTWQARGTAFDIDREPRSGGSAVQALTLHHGLEISGAGLDRSAEQGRKITLLLGGDGQPTGAAEVEPLDIASMQDGWLVENARLDRLSGYPLGELAMLPTPSPSPTAEPTETFVPTPAPEISTEPTSEPTMPPTPSPSPSPIATPKPTPTSRPTPVPTPRPTPKPTPRPTPKPTPAGPVNLGALAITATSPGCYQFSWAAYSSRPFSYWKLVYGNWGTSPYYPAYPYWAALDPATHGWSGCVPAGDYAVRVQAIDATNNNKAVAQTSIVRLAVTATATLPPTVNLGTLTVKNNGDGTYTFTWAPYTGTADWSYYKMPFEPWSASADPSYPGGDNYWAVPGTGDTSWTLTLGDGYFQPGDWAVRIQAVGYPNGSAYAYAQTRVLHLTLP